MKAFCFIDTWYTLLWVVWFNGLAHVALNMMHSRPKVCRWHFHCKVDLSRVCLQGCLTCMTWSCHLMTIYSWCLFFFEKWKSCLKYFFLIHITYEETSSNVTLFMCGKSRGAQKGFEPLTPELRATRTTRSTKRISTWPHCQLEGLWPGSQLPPCRRIGKCNITTARCILSYIAAAIALPYVVVLEHHIHNFLLVCQVVCGTERLTSLSTIVAIAVCLRTGRQLCLCSMELLRLAGTLSRKWIVESEASTSDSES